MRNLIVINHIHIFRLIPCLLAVIISSTPAHTQSTVGIGEVTSIEQKSLNIENNKQKISQYKLELPALEAALKAKLQKFQDEIIALQKERDNLIDDMKKGARCSQCKQWKSEFEKKGINFQQHLGEVKGYAVPATTEELEAVRKQYAEKIALKRVQMQQAEKNDKSIAQKQSDIKKLEDTNKNLCNEITNHSKRYETVVFADAKSKHQNWTVQLMQYVTSILIGNDRIAITKARAIREEKEFNEAIEKMKQLVKEKNEAEQARRNTRIDSNAAEIRRLQVEETNTQHPLKVNLAGKRDEKRNVELELKKPNLSDSLKRVLTQQLLQLTTEVNTLEAKVKQYIAELQGKMSRLRNDSKKMSDEIFQLKTGLSKQQDQATASIKIDYEKKKLATKQQETKYVAELADAKKTFGEKERYYQGLQDAFYSLVAGEGNRMVLAAQRVNCSAWNEARGKVAGNWNQVLPCVTAMATQAKGSSYNVFNSYCGETNSSTYMSAYKSFLSSLSPEDYEAVKGSSNITWFNRLTGQ